MSPEEFIRKNLARELESMKVPFAQIEGLANEGVRYWRETARFSKGAWGDTLAYTKKRATKAK